MKKAILKAKTTSRSLPMALLRARELIMTSFRPMLARHDISEQQWRVLRVLNEEKHLDASEVAKRASILGPSLTRIVKSLKAKRFLQTDQFASDGRRVIISITPAGTRLITEILPESLSIYEELDRRFGSQNIEKLLNQLEELLATPTPIDAEAETRFARGSRNHHSGPKLPKMSATRRKAPLR